MARRTAQSAAAPTAAPTATPRRPRNLLATLAAIGATTVVVPGFALVVAIGMIPSLVARLLDRGPQRYKSICVGMANWSGVFPYVIDVFSAPNSFAGAKAILASPITYVVMWGCAALGYLLFTTVPPVVATFLTVMAQRRIASLRATQKRLIDEWGEDVAKPGGGA